MTSCLHEDAVAYCFVNVGASCLAAASYAVEASYLGVRLGHSVDSYPEAFLVVLLPVAACAEASCDVVVGRLVAD